MNCFPGTALRVASLAEDVGGFDAAGFAAHYGNAFLVMYGVSPKGCAPSFRTNLADLPTTDVPQAALVAAARANMGAVEAFAVPIVRRPGSVNEFVSVGRLDGNDIHLADPTVSKCHAIIREVDGGFFILDCNSMNGTKVNNVAAGKRGERATRLQSGDIVQLATLTATFMDAAAVLALAQEHEAA